MKIVIDGKQFEAIPGEFILQAAKRNGIHIPTLCHHEALSGLGSCRLCIVDVINRGRKKVVTSCLFPITSEVEVITNSPKIQKMRQTIIKLLAARAPGNEYMKSLMVQYGVNSLDGFKGDKNEDCILCGLCAKACEELGTGAISTINRGITKKISTPYDEPSPACIGCSACASVCPTGAIKETRENGKKTIWGKEFNMAKCENCGAEFATTKQYEFVKKKLNIQETEKVLCPKCRKKLQSEKFKDIYQDVKPE